MIRRFLLRLSLFLLPVFIAILMVMAGGLFLGDALPISVILQRQDSPLPVVFGGVEMDSRGAYKANAIQHRLPEFLIMGSSRVHMMMPALVDDANLFYNSWIPGFNSALALELLQSIPPEHLPKVLLWSIDHRYFLAGERGSPSDFYMPNIDFQPMLSHSIISELNALNAFRQRSTAVGNLFDGTEPLLGWSAIASNARLGLTGFLNHGELFSGKSQIGAFYDMSAEERHNGYRESFDRREVQFAIGDGISSEKLDVLRQVLDFAHQHNIMVVGMLSPFSPMSYAWLQESDDFDYMAQIASVVTPIFGEYGFSFFDFTNPASIPLEDSDFLDAYHITPYGNLTLYRQLLIALPEVFAPYSSLERIDQLLENTDDPFLLNYYANAEGS